MHLKYHETYNYFAYTSGRVNKDLLLLVSDVHILCMLLTTDVRFDYNIWWSQIKRKPIRARRERERES